ncbi:tetratricopeptide repeat protein [Stakelama saccharophila]|uniref:Tetratricopeptide repeat protein n=1 Tax=Stakelama saccharophila TaxID=3075605 RepID=A0ABZ0BBT3_9SPHN|nr:tetratricopeptide repeat protein [Stakelama sp. W311]WNO54892.1 tetratricopeptide repeat protein [Stakelama sp. W311]
MALTPQSNEAFQREVDEELRREQLTEFGRRWGLWIGLLVVLLVAALGGWFYWQHRQSVRAGEQGVAYDQALKGLRDGNVDKVMPSLTELSDSDVDGYSAMARFARADALMKKDDNKGAAAILGTIAADASLAQPYRDLATVRRTAIEFDTMKPDAVVQRLRPLATKESPWFGSAGELVAIAYLRQGRSDLAAKMYSDIAAASGVPDSIRQRAVQMAAVLDGATKNGAAKGDAGDKPSESKDKNAQ